MRGISLYDYQELMLHRIEAQLSLPSDRTVRLKEGMRVKAGKSVMVQMPTGTGKTYVMAAVMSRFRAKGEIWVVAHRRELVEQMKGTLLRFGIDCDACAVHTGSICVRVMSVQWLARNVHRIENHPELIVIDEAHHSLAPTYQLMWTAFPEALKLGFTATPCRLKTAPFTSLYDVLLTSWSIKQFIAQGRLSLYDYVVCGKDSAEQLAVDSLGKRGSDGDYSIAEMEEKLDAAPSIARLYGSIERFAPGKKGIVYAVSIRHAWHIAQFYRSKGLSAVAIDSKSPAEERAQIVEDFRQGRIRCLVNVNLFDEGFDCPDVEFIQMARPTLSLSKYLQMVGRGLRVHPDKKLCVLIDNVGLYRLFGLPDAERDWMQTFLGEAAGRGKLMRHRTESMHPVHHDMVVIMNHSRLLPLTEEQEQAMVNDTVPFEHEGRWGLRSDKTIILPPVYLEIRPFVGGFCPFSIAPSRWGILSRKGTVIVKPEFKEIEIRTDGSALLKVNDFFTKTILLEEAEKEAMENRKWWKKHKEVMQKLTNERKRLHKDPKAI